MLILLFSKTFTNPATLESHLKSKKHKDTVFRLASQVKVAKSDAAVVENEDNMNLDNGASKNTEPVPSTSTASMDHDAAETKDQEATASFESSGDPKLDLLVARRIRCAPPVPVTTCLFCTHKSTSVSENKQHMRHSHSFALPEEEYLVDLEGLLRRLGEEIGTWNVCICCGKGYGGNINLDSEGQSEEEMRKRASKGVEAVRAHMQAKVRLR